MRSIVYNPASPAPPSSLLEGVESAICDVFGVRSLRHGAAFLEVAARDKPPRGAVAAAYNQVAANWRACRAHGVSRPSAQNWRWRAPQLRISSDNVSPEVVLERALVAACERAGRTDWSNQVPVASGVAGSFAERRRAIDLVHQKGPGWFQLVELKVASDTPLFAAMEIISYACIWLVSRDGPGASELLAARRMDAIVLAPESYYARAALGPLAQALDEEMAALGAEHGVQLGFAFETFPDPLARGPFTDRGLLSLLDERRRL